MTDTYTLKAVSFFSSERRHVLLQNKNGPCPLLALCNVLILRNDMTLPSNIVNRGEVKFDELVSLLADLAVARSQEGAFRNSDGEILPTPQLDELLSLMPSLQHGLDVNPKFTAGVTGYEYTDKLVPFDLFGVELVHGWLCDPSEPEYGIVKDKTYNELVNFIITGQEGGKEDDSLMASTQAASVFLDASAHQLTYFGLTQLHEHLRSNSLCVFFRNNHFSTIFKHDSRMFLLVTDQGYASVSQIVWEQLGAIDGDTEYVDSNFEKSGVRDDYVYNNANSLGSLGGEDAALQSAINASLLEANGVGGTSVGAGTTVASPLQTPLRDSDGEPSAGGGDIIGIGISVDGGSDEGGLVDDAQVAAALQAQINREEQSRADAAAARRLQEQLRLEDSSESRAIAAQQAKREKQLTKGKMSGGSKKKGDSCAIS